MLSLPPTLQVTHILPKVNTEKPVCELSTNTRTLADRVAIIRTTRGRDPHLVITNPLRVMFTSTRFFVLTGNAEALAAQLIKTPKVIGPKRAQMLFNLAAIDNNKIGRDALKQCAKKANRHHVDGLINDRVFNKASTLRLKFWAQNKNTPV